MSVLKRRVHSACIPCSGVGVGAGVSVFGKGGVELGLPPKSVCAVFVVGGVNSANFEGEPQALGVKEAKLVGSVNRGAEGPGAAVGAILVVTTFSAGIGDGAEAEVVGGVKIEGAGFSPAGVSDGAEAGAVGSAKIEGAGFSPAGTNDGAEAGAVGSAKNESAGFSPREGDNKTGGVFGRVESATVGGRGRGAHWPKGGLGAAGCATTAGGADLETSGSFSVSPSRTMGVLASGELRMGRLFERGARAKGEVGGGEALSVGTGIWTGAEGVSLTGEPGGVVLRSLTGDTRGTLEGEGV